MEAEALDLMVAEANTLPNHEIKVAMAVPAAAVAMAVAEGFNTARKQSLAGEESRRSDREATGYKRFANSARHIGGMAKVLQRRHGLDNTLCVWAKKLDCICY